MILEAMDWTSACVWFVWVWASVALTVGFSTPLLQGVWLFLKWPALAAPVFGATVQMMAVSGVGEKTLTMFWLAACVWCWWFYRNSGDDDYKRRLKRKAAEKVAALGGRLVVVPAPAS